MSSCRAVRTVALALVAGAVVNILVAWGIALFAADLAEDLWFDGVRTEHDAPSAWPYAAPDDWPPMAAHRSDRTSPGLDEHEWWTRFPEDRGRGHFVLEQLRVGMPMRCLALGERHDERQQALTVLQRGLRYSHEVNRGLPLDPLWGGLLVNTLVYAAFLLGCHGALSAGRRRSRQQRGRCPACGYARAGLESDAGCPECGHGPVV